MTIKNLNISIYSILLQSVCVYGGGDRKAQIESIDMGANIIIATPGRLNDLVEANVIDVCTITFLILDEGKMPIFVSNFHYKFTHNFNGFSLSLNSS